MHTGGVLRRLSDYFSAFSRAVPALDVFPVALRIVGSDPLRRRKTRVTNKNPLRLIVRAARLNRNDQDASFMSIKSEPDG